MSTLLDSPNLTTAVAEVALPDLFEVVNGRIVETPPKSSFAMRVANRLCRMLWRYLAANDIGEAEVEVLYSIPLPEDNSRNRRPDVSFVSYERWPRTRVDRATDTGRDVVPDLAAEVVSPSDKAEELIAKVDEYLRPGVRLVWVIYPIARKVHEYQPGAREIRVFTDADELVADGILPGFRTPVEGLFPPVERNPVEGDE